MDLETIKQDLTPKEKKVLELLKVRKQIIFSDLYPIIFRNKKCCINSIAVLTGKKLLKMVTAGVWESQMCIEVK